MTISTVQTLICLNEIQTQKSNGCAGSFANVRMDDGHLQQLDFSLCDICSLTQYIIIKHPWF